MVVVVDRGWNGGPKFESSNSFDRVGVLSFKSSYDFVSEYKNNHFRHLYH